VDDFEENNYEYYSQLPAYGGGKLFVEPLHEQTVFGIDEGVDAVVEIVVMK